jgi:integrase
MAVSSDTTGASVARRPKLIVMGAIRSRVVRGPRADGRWYWRAEVYESCASTTVWTGWATPAEMPALLAPLAAQPNAARPETRPRLVEVRTIQDLLEHWVTAQAERGDLKARSLEAYISIGNRLADDLGDVRLDRVFAETLASWRDRRMRAGKSARTLANDLHMLRVAWRWGAERALVTGELPGVRVRVLAATYHYSHATPEPDEVARVLAAIEARPKGSHWVPVAIQVLWSTGARIGEIAALTWKAVDLERNEIHVAGKTGPRRIPISSALRPALLAWRLRSGGSEALWPVSALTFTRKVPATLSRGCDLVGVPRWSPHALRRAAVVAMCRSGVDVGVAARVTGHSPAILLKHYRTVSDTELHDAVARAGLGAPLAGSEREKVQG